MKRMILLLLIAALLTACGQKQAAFPAVNIPRPTAAETTPAPEENSTAASEASEPPTIYAEPVATTPAPAESVEVSYGFHDEPWTDPEPTAFLGTWCTVNCEIYYVIDANMNYYRCGRNLEPEAQMRFWELSDKADTIVLRDGQGGIRDTLTTFGSNASPVLYDSEGNRFTKCEACMNGRYLCMISDAGTSDQPGGSLYVNRILDAWFTDAEVQTLRSKKVLPFRRPFGVDMCITSIQEQTDGTLLLNGKWELQRYAPLEAWRLVDYNRQLVGSGFAPVSDSVMYLDVYHNDQHDSLSTCLSGQPIAAYVTLWNGKVDCIEFSEPY